MQRVMTAPAAVLLQLDALRVVLLVLLGRVIAALAISTGQGDQRAHYILLNRRTRPDGRKTAGPVCS